MSYGAMLVALFAMIVCPTITTFLIWGGVVLVGFISCQLKTKEEESE